MLVLLIVSVLLRDGSLWEGEFAFYSTEECAAEGQAFDAFMATHGDLWIRYEGRCEEPVPEGAFVKVPAVSWARPFTSANSPL